MCEYRKKLTVVRPVYLFLLALSQCVAVVAGDATTSLKFPDAKSKSVYVKINAKIARYKSERAEKIRRIKAKQYPPATESRLIDRINLKINRAIQKYKTKGNTYFRRRGMPEPWNSTSMTEILKKPTIKPTPSEKSETVMKPCPIVRQPKHRPVKSEKVPKRTNSSDSTVAPSTPAGLSQPVSSSPQKTPLQRSSSRQDGAKSANTAAISGKSTRNGNIEPRRVSSKVSSPSHSGWKIFAAVMASLFFFLATLMIIANVATWKKQGVPVKIVLGCGSLFFGFLSLTTVLLTAYIFTFKSPGRNSTQAEKRMNSYMTKNASNWQDLGADIFAEAVVEGDKDKLFKSIEYLEKAYAGSPDNNGIAVDLADAYMEVDSPSLTAVAIELYESIFDSFDDDPLVARLAAAYFQLKNYDAAFAFAEERVKRSSDEKRLPAALQMALIAAAAHKEDAAILAVGERMKGQAYDPAMDMIVAILLDAKGDKNAALAKLDFVSKTKNLDPKLRRYLETLRKRFSND